METLLQFIDLMRYFGSLEVASAFCENIYWNTLHNTNENIVSACSTVWNTTYNLTK